MDENACSMSILYQSYMHYFGKCSQDNDHQNESFQMHLGVRKGNQISFAVMNLLLHNNNNGYFRVLFLQIGCSPFT